MPIQFNCSGCGQAIEVDSEFAGRLVACPFCHATVEAPSESRLVTPPVATPSPPPAPGTPPPLPQPLPYRPATLPPVTSGMPPGAPQRDDGAKFCTMAFVIGLLLLPLPCLIGVVAASQTELMDPNVMQSIQTRPQVEQQEEFARIFAQWGKDHAGMAYTMAALTGLLTLAGIVTGIVGLARGWTRRWQGILGLVLSITCGACGTLSPLVLSNLPATP